MKLLFGARTTFLIFCCFTAGCKKFVQIPPPDSQLVTKSTFNSSGSATAAVTSIYTQMQSDSYTMSLYGGLLSDELNVGVGNAYLRQYYANAMNPYSFAGPWLNAYTYIYQANAIIEQLKQNNDLDSRISDQLTGESKFIRAFWLFYLVNCYGDVPLVISTDYTVNSVIGRSSSSKVYSQIISDLNDAQNLLNGNYVDGSDTTISTERVRPTKWAASALLARVYLYTKDFVNAEKCASIVINNSSLYNLNDSLNDVFKANSTEAIWQLGVPLPTNVNTQDGNSFILIASPNSGGGIGNTSTLSSQLLDSFETGDMRKEKWVGAFITSDSPSISYYYPYKYKVFQSSTVTEYTMMLRLAEQFLIRAEARAQQNVNLSGAQDDLNKIRYRAGLPLYTGTPDKSSLLTEILHERKFEFFCEWGHRWFDLVRTGNANAVMSIVTPLKGGVWNTDWQLFPIPQSERNLDINLTQNPGY